MKAQQVTPAGQQVLLNDLELARYYGVSIATVRKWRLRGQGPKWIKLGALVRYRVDDAQAYLNSLPLGGGDERRQMQGGGPAANSPRDRQRASFAKLSAFD